MHASPSRRVQDQSEVDCVDDDVDGVFELVLEVDDESIPLALAFALEPSMGPPHKAKTKGQRKAEAQRLH